MTALHNPALAAQVARVKAARARMGMERPLPLVTIERPRDIVQNLRPTRPQSPLDAANRKVAEAREMKRREEAERARQQMIADRKLFLESRKSGNHEMRAIVLATARHFNIPAEKLMSDRRVAQYSLPRQVAMYLVKELTTLSFHNIGRRFHRDHTTVLHAWRKITCLLSNGNPVVTLAVAAIKDLLNGDIEEHYWGA